jgi:flavin reductase (DIM6/NTAB) family NADH-FMN oxidoreductase RutF
VLRRDDGSEKDTLINLRASGELVINAVTEAIVHAANACAENLPAHRSEFEFAGLTPAFLSSRTPHVAQSPLRFECRVESEIPFGGDRPGGASLVIVSVTRAYVAKPVYRGRGQLDIAALRLIGRSSVDQYLVADGQFTIVRPNTGESVA